MITQHIQMNIPISFTQVLDAVMQLSTFEKQQLSELLLKQQNNDNLVIPEEHKKLVMERIEKYENKPDSYLSWNDIECKMSER